MKSRGSALVQVLIMGMLLLVLISLLVKSVAQHYQFGALSAAGASSAMTTGSVIQAVQTAWTEAGQQCASYNWPSPSTDKVCCDGSSCGQSLAGTCNCTCTVTLNGQASPVQVVASVGAGGQCQLTAITTYP